MTLAQTPADTIFLIQSVAIAADSDLDYIRQGLRSGSWAKLICRHPVKKPVVFEVLLDNTVHLTVPAALANRVKVSPSAAGRSLT